MPNNQKSRRGRPSLPLPEPINRPMDEIARTVLRAKPKHEDEWKYLQERKAERARRKGEPTTQ